MIKVKRLSETWVKLFEVFSKSQKHKYWLTVLLAIAAAFLEILGVSVLLHTILSILKPEFIGHNFFTKLLSQYFGITDQIHFVVLISVVLLAVYIVKNALIVFINKLQVKFAYEVTEGIAEKRYDQLAHSDLLYFVKRRTSQLVNELFGGIMALPDLVITPSILLLSELFIVILLMSAVAFYNPVLFTFLALTLLPTAAFLIIFNRKQLQKKGSKIHEISPLVYDNINQLSKGIANIKLWNGTKKFIDEFKARKKEFFTLKGSIYIDTNFIPIRIYEVVAITGILAVVLYVLVNNEGNSNLISYISLYAGISFRLLPSLNRIIGSMNTLSTYSHLLNYFDDDFKKWQIKTNDEKIEKIAFTNTISLNDISFSYGDNEILDGASISIHRGDFVGLIGKSGSGKSTFVNILTSLFPLERGVISVDNMPINEDNINSYRFLYSYVKQDVFLLNDSILKNIGFLQSNIDLKKVERCLEAVNLLEWVKSLEKGLETQVGELGNKLSGGQRQRIALARALYKDSEIFIFDEATNNLDSASIEQTLSSVKALKDLGKTAIFITHKKDELNLCDSVYSIIDKKVIKVEKG